MSDINYLEALPIHNFEESMTISESALETIMMIEEEWNTIEESVDINPEDTLFENELLGIQEAEGEKKGFKETLVSLGKSIIEMLKKIASYIMGMVSKWLIALDQLIKKDAGILKDKARIERGAARIKAEDKKIKVYGLLCNGFIPKAEALKSYLEKSYGFHDGNKIFAKTQAEVDDLNSKIDNEGDVFRGKITGDDSVSAKDFAKVITQKMTGEENPREYVFGASNIDSAMHSAIDTIKSGADQKKKCKESYEGIRRAINDWVKDIAKLSSHAKTLGDDKKATALAAIKAAGKLYKTAASVCSAAQARVLSNLSADYRLNSTLIIKLYAAGGSDAKAKRDAKAAFKNLPQEEPASVSTTQESVESIFGMDLI